MVEVEVEDDQHHQCSLATLGRSAVVLWHSAAPQRVFRTVNSIIAFEHHCTIFTVEHIPCAQLSTFAWENVPPPSYLSHEGSWGWLACLGSHHTIPYHAWGSHWSQDVVIIGMTIAIRWGGNRSHEGRWVSHRRRPPHSICSEDYLSTIHGLCGLKMWLEGGLSAWGSRSQACNGWRP